MRKPKQPHCPNCEIAAATLSHALRLLAQRNAPPRAAERQARERARSVDGRYVSPTSVGSRPDTRLERPESDLSAEHAGVLYELMKERGDI